MSSVVFAAVGLTVVALSAVLLVRGVSGSRRSRLIVGALILAPAILVCGVLLASLTSLGSVRIAFEGAQFRIAPNDDVTVGGAEGDDVVVAGLPEHFLEFHPVNGGIDVLLQESVVADQDGNGYAVVRVDGNKPFANAVALRGGSPIEIASKAFTLDKPGFVDTAGRTYPAIPTRAIELGPIRIPILRALPPEVQIQPLRFLAAPATGNDVARSDAGRPYGSFICREGGFFRRTSYIVLAGDGVQVKVGDKMVAYDPRIARIDAGQSHTFALYRVDYADPRLPYAARSRVQERRSFSAAFDGTALKIVFDTPEFASVPRTEIERLAAANSKEKARPTFALTIPGLEETLSPNEMLLRFASAGSRLGYELFGRIRLEEAGPCPLRVTTHEGTRCFRFGDGFSVGEDAAALFRISRFGAPYGSMVLIVAACLATLFFGTSPGDTALHVVTYAAVELLLGLRILIGYAGSVGDPAAAPAYWQSILALVVAPFVIRAGIRLERGEREWTLAAHAIVMAVATAVVFSHLGGLNLAFVAIVLISFAAVAGTAWLWRVLELLVSDAALRRPWRLILFATALFLFRALTFGILGWKERMTLPFGAIAVSLYYVPATIILFSMIWGIVRLRMTAAAPPGQSTRRRAAEALGVAAMLYLPLAFFHGVLPKLVSDLGSIFVFAPPLLLFFALPLLERRGATQWTLAAPSLFVVLLVAAPLVGVLRSGRAPRKSPVNVSPAQAEKVIEARVASSDNWLRVLSLTAPDRVESGGTNASERLVVLERTLRRYDSRGVLGAGYLHVPVTQTVEETQLNDNLSSIHVMAAFGWLGTAALLLIVVLPAVAPFFALRGSGQALVDAIDSAAAIGILSLWTITGAALYMFAANLGLVFFTGKNVYFLAAASESDVSEGVILIVLALVALAHSAALHPATSPPPQAGAGVTP